jgi:alkylation response protein AidB-like acyl-CoA dehydrogenase
MRSPATRCIEVPTARGAPDSVHRGAELVLTRAPQSGHLPAETARASTSFTIFEGTSEIQRMIIGRAVTGLDVR